MLPGLLEKQILNGCMRYCRQPARSLISLVREYFVLKMNSPPTIILRGQVVEGV